MFSCDIGKLFDIPSYLFKDSLAVISSTSSLLSQVHVSPIQQWSTHVFPRLERQISFEPRTTGLGPTGEAHPLVEWDVDVIDKTYSALQIPSKTQLLEVECCYQTPTFLIVFAALYRCPDLSIGGGAVAVNKDKGFELFFAALASKLRG